MAPGGYFGAALVVDVGVAGASASRLELSDAVLRSYLGGVGLGTYLLHRLGPAGVDPLAPEALLAFVFSPLVGTPLTTSAKFAVVAKSPLTGLLTDALASSQFAIAGKLTGHDAIVVRGRTDVLSVLLVDADGVRIEAAPEVAGLSAADTETALRERFGRGWRAAVIGPAGERGVHYATISHDGRHAGRGGLGAVLGAKNLKAVLVRAAGKAPVHDADAVLLAAKDLRERSFGPATAKYRELGTLANLLAFNAVSTLPTRNFTAATFEAAPRLAAEELHELRQVARNSCASCSIGCEHIYSRKGGGQQRMEYENVFALGPMCGVGDPDDVFAASARCDELGLDTISAGGTIAWAMECVERGLLDAPWLCFGDGAALLRALDEIGGRSTDLGELLAQGSRRAAAQLGQGSENFALHVKGLELPGYEPRTMQAMALGLAVNSRGADHNRSGAYEADLSGDLDRLAGGPAHVHAAVGTEDRAAVMDSMILCKFLRGVFSDPFTEWAALLRPVTGWDLDADELRATARRIVNAKRAFNLREGAGAADDTLPPRILEEPVTMGSGRDATLTRPRLQAMVDGYYAERGWDAAGRPDGSDLVGITPGRTTVAPPPHVRGSAITAVQEPRSAARAAVRTIGAEIDGVPVTVDEGTTIFDAAKQAGIDIPVLCHNERYDPVGVCRVCVVDTGGRVFAASCVRPCEDGMTVTTTSPELERSRSVLTELLLADQPLREEDPKDTTTADNKLLELADRYGVSRETTDLPIGSGRGVDLSNPVIAVDHDSCILCDRCVRACDDLQGNDVIGRSGKGYATRIAFDLNDPMGASSCVTCGECVQACPTGALTNKAIRSIPIQPREQLEAVESVCPYCGVGCALTYWVDRDRGAISFAEGRPQPGSQSRLCVKGRYGWDYSASPQRLMVPLIRRESAYPKGALSADVRGEGTGKQATGRDKKDNRPGKDRGRKPGGLVDYDEVLPHFREATWDEALDLIASRLKEIHAEDGPVSIAGFGSAKCSNEEAYLFQKLIRAGFGTNNVDHCTRLCHASSVAALFEGVGSGAVSTTYGDVANADVAIITGSNPTANHPVASSFFKQARRRGTTIIYVDPRASTVSEHADIFVQLKPGTDVAFYNSVMCEIIQLGLTDPQFIADRTSNYEALAATVADYPPERAEQITGVPADTIRAVARAWGEAGAAVVYWGMGISQHTTGTDNARCLIALCSITGQVGRPGTGLHPLRGQNNVQGASDAGLIPMFLPDYQSVERPGLRENFEAAWGVPLDPKRGLTVTEIISSILAGGVRGMYMLGENPFLSDPNTNKVRKALSALDFLVVQDIFLTETAEFADVILPATSYLEKDGTYTNTDRRVQLGRKVLDPPGEARADWAIVADIARRIGLDWDYASPSEVFDEMVALMPSYTNLTYDNLGPSGKLYPNPDPENSDGTVVMFDERFNTEDGLAHLVPAQWLPPKELPDSEYPLVLNTGRLLEHWHTGTMTRRSFALDAIAPIAEVYMHPKDAADRGLVHGAMARTRSRRGQIELQVRISHREQQGNVFIPFHFREAAANLLTIDEVDPVGKIPEFKFCAVQVEPIGTVL